MKPINNDRADFGACTNKEFRAHITDSIFFGDGFSTLEVRAIFSDKRRMQRWLEVEVALAQSQAELGIIPKQAAVELSRTANLKNFDVGDIINQIQHTKHSLVPLLQAWQSVVSKDVAQYIHYGATTQDIQDTAQVLELRDVIYIVERDLQSIITKLARLAKRYRALVMIGRTHSQHAMPITLGLKISGWLDECMRNFDRLAFCKTTLLASQLFGAVGTMAAFSENGPEILRIFSKKLGLACPSVAWHNARDRFVDFVSILAMIAGVLGRISNEIIQLGKNEVCELAESHHDGQIGSSTMPQKCNPEDCERIIALSKLVKNQTALSFDTLISEHERDYRTMRLEWVAITDASLYACCALATMNVVLEKLVVNEKTITNNVISAAPTLTTEALMFLLSKKIHKNSAASYVNQAFRQARKNSTQLIDELQKFEEVAKNFNKKQLETVLDPFQYIGVAHQLVDNILEVVITKFQLKQL